VFGFSLTDVISTDLSAFNI